MDYNKEIIEYQKAVFKLVSIIALKVLGYYPDIYVELEDGSKVKIAPPS